ncbi:MAG TPA: tetratricopeptide repeat protein, partial [Chitinophagaceae bacterium]
MTTPCIRLIILLGLLPLTIYSFAQPAELNAKQWAAELSKKHYSADESFRKLSVTLANRDSVRVFQFINELAEEGKSNSYYFQARFNCLKAGMINVKSLYYEFYQDRKPVDVNSLKKEIMNLLASAIDIAYRSEDDYLIAFVSYTYSITVNQLGETALTVMYAKNAIDLYEKLSYPILPNAYQFLAEKLYQVREYDECIKYAKKSVIAWRQSPEEYKPFTISSMNTVALGYHRQKNYDSAMIFYGQALDYAKQTRDTLWAGIVLGNMGQLFYVQGKYDTAYSLLISDYKASKERGYFDNAANSLQWAAKTNLAKGNKATALAEVREAAQLLGVWPDANYLRNAYYTTAQVFREMGNYDSAFYYTNLYVALNDSLERVIAASSLAISKARLNDETSRYRIQTLNREKRSQLMLRNVIIAGVVILSLLALAMLNRKRLKTKLEKEKI